MGYTTYFSGEFSFNKKLDDKLGDFLRKFNDSRRVARDIKGFGVEGEFYVDGHDYDDKNIIDCNRPPKTQPSLWCGWTVSSDNTKLMWDGSEKFYSYVDWLSYLIKNFIAPNKYKLNGKVEWCGEEFEDRGIITVKNNCIFIQEAIIKYGKKKLIK